MLRHNHIQAVDPSGSASDARVTPEELAKALAAVEARKEASAREDAATVSIGEAAQHLGFDATPDEIWAEVQALRQHPGHTQMMPLPRKTRLGLLIAAGAVAIVLAASQLIAPPENDTTASPAALVPSQSYVSPPDPQTVICTLPEIADGASFYCDEATAEKILMQKPLQAAGILVTKGKAFAAAQMDNNWTFTKHHDALYVHGYTAPRSDDAMRLGHIPIYNEANDQTGAGGSNNTQPVTLEVGAFHTDGFSGGGLNSCITVSQLHPDQHYRDAW